MLTDLAEAARKSGLTVIEIPGWRTHGHAQMSGVRTIVAHHTATAASAPGDYPSINVVRNGRTGLPGPLSQLGLGRDGTVYVIAAGLSYHAGKTHHRDQGNAYAIGIEAEHPGTGPWPKQQRDAYVRLCAALVDHYGLTVSRVQGHKEVAAPTGRKSDPNFDMDAFRADITDILQEDDMANGDEILAELKQINAHSKRTRDLVLALARQELARSKKNQTEHDSTQKALADLVDEG